MKRTEPKPLGRRSQQNCKVQELQKEVVSLARKNLDNQQNQKQVVDVFNETSRKIAEIKTYDFSKFCQSSAFL